MWWSLTCLLPGANDACGEDARFLWFVAWACLSRKNIEGFLAVLCCGGVYEAIFHLDEVKLTGFGCWNGALQSRCVSVAWDFQ